jgi:signal transduction histidine kinase
MLERAATVFVSHPANLNVTRRSSSSARKQMKRTPSQKKPRARPAIDLASFPEQNPNPVVQVSLDGQLEYLNHAARRLFPELSTQRLSHPWLADWISIREIFRDGKTLSTQRQLLIGNRYFEQLINHVPGTRHVRIYGSDITQRKHAEEALRASERKYRGLFDSIPEMVGLYQVVRDAQGEIVDRILIDGNPSLIHEWDFGSLDEIRGKTSSQIYGEAYADSNLPSIRKAMASGVKQLMDSHRPKVDRYYEAIIVPLDETFFLATARDVTELRRAQQALRASRDNLERLVDQRTAELERTNERLHLLAHDIVTSQEDERRRVSRELHDQAGQALTALKLTLQSIRDDLASLGNIHIQHLEEALSLTDDTHEQIRALAQNLRPPALDSAGLDAALEGLCTDWARRSQTRVDYFGDSNLCIAPTASICLYRFLQEALTNAARHGHATQVKVALQRDDREVCLSVADNGAGFDPQPLLANHPQPKGMGLAGMQERLAMLGGSLEIRSKPGQGAALIAHVPLEAA